MTSYPYPTDFDCNKLAQEETCKHRTERLGTDGGVEPGQHDQTESQSWMGEHEVIIIHYNY